MYGMAFLTGVSQAASDAAATLKPIILRKSLLEGPESSGAGGVPNSLDAFFTATASFFSSGIPFQYVFFVLIIS
jgi:hypothetical protein